MFRAIPSPRLFPDLVAQHSVTFTADAADAALAALAVPPALAGAVTKRKIEFAAGRACARAALRDLGADDGEIAMAPDRSPLWPRGVIGSITHSDGLASAAVVRDRDAAGIGIDCERIIAVDSAARISGSIAPAGELRALGDALAPELLLTIVFSAKETIYKCLHRHVGRFFYFHAVAITQVALDEARFFARVLEPLAPSLPPGTEVRGRVTVDGARVHTGALLLSLDAGTRWF